MGKVYSMDVMVTDRCNADCPHCINKSYRTAAEISVPDFKNLAKCLSGIGYSQLRLMGGEPTIHPSFSDIVKISQTEFRHVVVMTNGRGDSFLQFKPRDSDRVVYNLNAMPLTIDVAMLKVDEAGDRVFSVVFSKDSDAMILVEKAKRIASVPNMLERAVFDIVIDLTEDLFETRTGIQEKVRLFYKACSAIGAKMSIVSPRELPMLYPMCFREYASDSIGTAPAKLCHRSTPGHVDAELYWRFCHAFPVRLGKFGTVSWEEVCRRAVQCCKERLMITQGRCGKCTSFGVKCDGGCFALTKLAGYSEIESRWGGFQG